MVVFCGVVCCFEKGIDMSRVFVCASARVLGGCIAAGLACAAHAQTLDPAFAANYSVFDLGSVPGVPPANGGLTFSPTDPDVLYIGGAANAAAGAVYTIQVRRNQCREIIGFLGTAVQHSTAPYIDGGLAFSSDGVLLSTGYPVNTINMTEPGSTAPDRIESLTPLGVGSSTGTLAFVPADHPGAGRFKIASYSGGGFYDATLTPDGNGTYTISNVAQTAFVGGGPEGIAYVPIGSPQFPNPSVLVTKYGFGSVVVYDTDAQGNPVVATERSFITGLGGAEGAVIDPVTGHFLFSTFGGGNRVIAVRGFAAARVCDSVDFNNDGLFPDTLDIDDYLSVFAGGTCTNDPNCGDVDFNNDCLFPDTSDIDALLTVFSGGVCM
jgi:hypothetical protein